MTEAADRVFTNAVVHPLDGSERTAEAVAVRDGRVVRVGPTHEIEFLAGVETDVLDLGGRHLLPGFVDAHTHLEFLGRRAVECDLTGVDSRGACLDRLRETVTDHREDDWILGFGYDESRWDGDCLTRADLDTVSDERPVVAFREDMHTASVNGVVFERYGEQLPEEAVRTDDGDPTGVVLEAGVETLYDLTAPSSDVLREYLQLAQARATERGITTVHDMVRRSAAPRVYRDLEAAGDLDLRVRINYWADHLDAVLETGLVTNHGSDQVRVGAIKAYVDGSLGARTARLADPYADGDGRGEFLTPPADLAALVDRVDDAGLQLALHAIGDEAIEATLEALADTAGTRHRIEHAELLTDELIQRVADADLVVSAQPNFLKWARDGGLYDRRLGPERRRRSNRLGALQAAGARLAFGSDCMPLDPLLGIQEVCTAPEPAQRLPVTDAVRAYTAGGAYAGFDEHRLGTVTEGACADFAVLDASPWAVPHEEIADIAVTTTVLGGEVVHDDR